MKGTKTMNKHIFEKLFNLYAKDVKVDEEIVHLAEKLEKELISELDDKKLIIFRKYEDSKQEETELLSYESFKQGFRASILLALEVMQN
jgi:hypothetical protein